VPVYTYQGVNRLGAPVRGERSAANKEELATVLRRESVRITRVAEKGRTFEMPMIGGKVSAKDMAVFTRQLSVMIDCGLPLVQCLQLLAEQQENPAFKKVLTGVRAGVEGGSTLSAAMGQFPRVFDPLFVNMVQAGETGGILDAILQRLSAYLEKNVKLKRQVKSAMIYPAAVIIIAVGVIVLLLWKVVPVFAGLFAGLGAELPLPTRIVIGLSRFVGSIWGLAILIFVVLVAFATSAWYRTEPGRLAIDQALLRLPLVGILLRKIAVARFTRTLGTLLASGVAILEALDITARTSGNAVLERAILRVRRGVEGGQSLVDPLAETKVFPNMVTQMIAVGEQTGAMDAMLSKIADFYEEEVDAGVKDLLSAMEPVMIVFLGVVVGGIVISMYLPLFSLIAKLSG
jgi:type IV pilus assembly protein PilC